MRSPKRRTSAQIIVMACSLLYLIVFVLMLVLHPGSRRFYQDFHNGAQIFPPLFATVCAMVYGGKGQHSSLSQRMAWLFIGLGSFYWALGQLTWTYYESIRAVEVPYPGLADAGYLVAYPCLAVGVMLLVCGSAPVDLTSLLRSASLLLTSALAVGGAGVLLWYFLMQPLWLQPSDPVEKVIGLAYPLCDMVALFSAAILVQMAIAMRRRILRCSLGLLAGGLVLLALGDAIFTYYNLKEIYQTGSWFDWMFSLGWLLIGYAALLLLWYEARFPTHRPLWRYRRHYQQRYKLSPGAPG